MALPSLGLTLLIDVLMDDMTLPTAAPAPMAATGQQGPQRPHKRKDPIMVYNIYIYIYTYYIYVYGIEYMGYGRQYMVYEDQDPTNLKARM